MDKMTFLINILIILTIGFTSFADEIIYVDDDAKGANDGTNWENAFTYLQDALTTAKSTEFEKPLEIRVAQGIYKPNQGLIEVVPGGIGRGRQPYPPKYPADLGVSASFALINGVNIRGGYAGVNKSDPNARDVKLYESVLSGDLYGDDIEADDPYDLFDEPTRSDNSWNVIKSTHNDANAVIDGFTITGGNFLGRPFGGGSPLGGAGMLISSGSPTLIDCKFTRNVTGDSGGGILVYGDGNTTLINCVFSENYAELGAGIYNSASKLGKRDFNNLKLINCLFDNNYACWIGSGIYYNGGGNSSLFNCKFSRNFGSGFVGGGSPEFVECIFIQNTAGAGGGVSCGGSPKFKNCIFSDNSAKYIGGGMECSNGLLTDCIFSGNSAAWGGGGLAGSDLVLNNCIFTGNKVYGEESILGEGGGCAVGGDNITITNCTFYGNCSSLGNAISQYRTSFLRLTNCILWDEGDEISGSPPSTLTVTYSNIKGGFEGEGNIDTDPLFNNPGYWADADDPNIAAEPNDPNAVWIDGDYHLKSQAGRWDPNSQSWVQDDVTSPCIDAGDPNTPIGHEPFPNGGIINMGAYGGTDQASKSYFGGPVCETIIAGDINGDCKVDFDDLMILMNHWLEDYTPQD